MVDHIDGSLTYVVVLAAESIKYSLSNVPANEIATKFIALSEIQNSIFHKSSPTTQIETSFMVFCCLAYKIPNRADLL